MSAYRRWYDAAGAPPYAKYAVDTFRSTPLDKAALLDRYSQHTAHCKSCAGALATARKASQAAKVLLLALGTLVPWIVANRWGRIVAAAAAGGSARGLRAMLGVVGATLVALRPLLCLGAGAGVTAGARSFALSVERRLTSGALPAMHHRYTPRTPLPLHTLHRFPAVRRTVRVSAAKEPGQHRGRGSRAADGRAGAPQLGAPADELRMPVASRCRTCVHCQ